MKSLLLAVLLLTCSALHAQVSMKDGKVFVKGKLICYYLEGPQKENELKHHASVEFSQLSADFRDVFFSSPQDSFLAVSVEAKVLAHARLAYITYYYSVRFFSTGDVVNIAYKPLRLEALVKDFAKCGIFRDGIYQSDALPQLLEKWKVKDGVLDNDLVATGVSIPYVQQGADAIQDSIISNVFVREGNIYRGDSIIARYKEGPPLDPARGSRPERPKTWYIRNLAGKDIMVLTAHRLRSVVFALDVQSGQEFKIVTPDKSETRLVRAAAGFLMLLNEI